MSDKIPSPRKGRVPAPAATGLGNAAKKSKAKAESATRTAVKNADMVERAIEGGGTVPLTPDGRPMAKITVSGAELIPHGDYANISCGPCMFEIWVDPLDEEPVHPEVAEGLAKAANKVFDALYGDVLSVQRALIQGSIEKQQAAK